MHKPIMALLHTNKREYQKQLELFYQTHPDMIYIDILKDNFGRKEILKLLWITECQYRTIIKKKTLSKELIKKINNNSTINKYLATVESGDNL